MQQNITLFKEELAKHSSFEKVATAGNVPGRTFGRTGITPEGAAEDDIWIMSRVSFSGDTFDALGMEIVEGEKFRPDMTRENFSVIINETAVRELGWENPLEKRFFLGPDDSTGVYVSGVVKDFNFIEMHQNIEPVIIFPMIQFPGSVVIGRIAPGQINAAMEHINRSGKRYIRIIPSVILLWMMNSMQFIIEIRSRERLLIYFQYWLYS